MTTFADIPEFGIGRENEERRDGGCGVVFDPQTQRYAVGKRDDGLFILFGGGVEAHEDIQTGVLREITEESGLFDFEYVEKTAEAFAHYRHTTKNLNRITKAVCFLVVLRSARCIGIQHEAHEKFTLHWVMAADLLANWRLRSADRNHDHWVYFLEKSVRRAVDLGYVNIK